MYSFRNDYSDGGHPEILEALSKHSLIQTEGYCEDEFTLKATALIRERIGSKDPDIHLIAGGTLTNRVALSAFLRPHEAVISAHTGHIYVHETGAVESSGHKVIPVESADGKLTPAQITDVVTEHHFEHMVKPRLVYISQPTEIGTLYSKKEMERLRDCCSRQNLLLYADGARLSSALASDKNSLQLEDYTKLCDSYYIGGTKSGALLGEALVICNNELKNDFRYNLKQNGALLAKGRILGIQFMTFFDEDLYLRIGRLANTAAAELQNGMKKLGYRMKFESFTNQIFPVLPDKIIAELEKDFLFYRWEKAGADQSVIRLVCSWATERVHVQDFLDKLRSLD